MNKFIGIGRITKDIELAYTQDGKAVAKYTLAINGYNDKTDFLNCVTWDKQAENLKKYCGKGSQIAVEGRVSVRNYENKEGKKIYVTEIVTNNITFLDTKKEGQAPREDTYNDLHTTTSSDDSAFADFGETIELSEEDIDFEVAF
jgi:single-strand DNA-binding protein